MDNESTTGLYTAMSFHQCVVVAMCLTVLGLSWAQDANDDIFAFALNSFQTKDSSRMQLLQRVTVSLLECGCPVKCFSQPQRMDWQKRIHKCFMLGMCTKCKPTHLGKRKNSVT